MSEEKAPPFPESLRTKFRKARRGLRKWFRRGFGFRLGILLGRMFLVFYVLLALYIVYIFLSSGVLKLDWNTVISIVIADLPVGFILWFILERGQSKTRKVLDAVDRVEAPTKFNHLEVDYVDEYDDGIYSDILYFVVNTRTGEAFWVDETVQDLIEARVIRRHRRFDTKDTLNRYFASQGIKLAGRLPEGDDLFRSSPV